MAVNLNTGIVLEPMKEPAVSRGLRSYLNPEEIYVPCYKEKLRNIMRVSKDQPVYVYDDGMALHAGINGRFVRDVTITNPDDTGRYFVYKNMIGFADVQKPQETDRMSITEITAAAKAASIIDENDGVYLYKKLEYARKHGKKTLVVDCVEDEPYVSCMTNLLLKNQAELSAGIQLAVRAMQTDKACIAVYKQFDEFKTKIPKLLDNIRIKNIHGKYPLRYRLKYYFKEHDDIVTISAGALVHLYRACKFSKPQTSCFVTVAGDCVSTPYNIEVTIGTPVRDLLQFCGLKQEPDIVIYGGSMTGHRIEDLEQPIGHTTKAVLTMKTDIVEKKTACISCGRCNDICPQDLLPHFIYKYAESGVKHVLSRYNIDHCIECGCCSYVCPANMGVAASIRRAKKLIGKEQASDKNGK